MTPAAPTAGGGGAAGGLTMYRMGNMSGGGPDTTKVTREELLGRIVCMAGGVDGLACALIGSLEKGAGRPDRSRVRELAADRRLQQWEMKRQKLLAEADGHPLQAALDDWSANVGVLQLQRNRIVHDVWVNLDAGLVPSEELSADRWWLMLTKDLDGHHAGEIMEITHSWLRELWLSYLRAKAAGEGFGVHLGWARDDLA